ncbi:MAG: hypothetical protein WC091_13355 [Sulfuricellaceae bacterium]
MTISPAQYTAWLAADGKAREVLIEVGCNHGGVEIVRYLSIYGRTTGPAESPPNTPYLSRLNGKISFSRKVSVTSTEPSVQMQVSSIDLDNLDGDLDAWMDDVWEKRALRVYIGDPSWPRADFRQILAGRVAALNPNGRSGLKLDFYDELLRLNCPVTEATLGGTSSNKDAILPVAFGEVFNVTPLLVDEGNHEYQVHNGQIELFIEGRDNGAPASSTPNPAAGKFRLDQHPVGQITCDVQGAKPGGVYAHTLASIVKDIVMSWGYPDTRLSIGEIDDVNFAAFDASNNQTLGLYLDGKTNVIDACNQLCSSLQASLYFSSAGLLRLWRPPASAGAPMHVYTPGDIDPDSFEVVEIIPATPAVTLGWGRNWTVQSSGLAWGLPESAVDDLKLEWREYAVSDAAAVTLRRYTTRPTREDTLLVDESDAQVEAGKRLDFRRVPHKIVQFKTTLSALEHDIGTEITIIYPRAGCESGKSGWIIGVTPDLGMSDSPFRVLLEVLL